MGTQETPYDAEFFQGLKDNSYRSARVVAPILLELIAPRSVVDLGSGVGAWLKAFLDHGIEDVLGLDGDYVDRSQFMIPKERFQEANLQEAVQLDRRFDLAMSLEVAEHLPERCADTFVDSLVRLAPVVLFSAAIPMQGGVEHVNEQWQDYWAEKFAARSFTAVDCIRPRIWRDPDVELWYAQNTLLFVSSAALDNYPKLKDELPKTRPDQLSVVHPEFALTLARNFAKKAVPMRRLLRWRVRGMRDRNYRYDSGARQGMAFRRGS